MQVQALINEDNTEAALFFPEPYPGYTLTMNAAQVDQLIKILEDLRHHMRKHQSRPPPSNDHLLCRPEAALQALEQVDRLGRARPQQREPTISQRVVGDSRGRSVDKILVLIVEDDVLIQLGIETALHDGGYATEAEGSGEKAIAKLEAIPEIRALITDINLQH